MDTFKSTVFFILINIGMATGFMFGVQQRCDHSDVYKAIENSFSSNECISVEKCAMEITNTLDRCFGGRNIKWIAAVWTPSHIENGGPLFCFNCTSISNACSCYPGSITITRTNNRQQTYGFLVASTTCHIDLPDMKDTPALKNFQTRFFPVCTVREYHRWVYAKYAYIPSLCSSGALRYVKANGSIYVNGSPGSEGCLKVVKGNNDDILMWFLR